MNLTEIGAIREARAIAEALLLNPSGLNFSRYRKALVNITYLFGGTIEEAAVRVHAQPIETEKKHHATR